MSSVPSVNVVSDATFELWRQLANFPASETDAALKFLQEWIAENVDADNVIWIGAVRILQDASAKADPFLGWRLRARHALRADPSPYRQQFTKYYDTEHYGKLTPTYYRRSHETKGEDHIGIGSRAAMASAGRFRVIELRNSVFFDFAEFEKSAHYKRYYRDVGIVDRITIGFPVGPNLESFFMIDRYQAKARRRNFTHQEAVLAGDAVRGIPQLHRRLFLANGLLASDKLLSPMERQIMRGLLTGQTENQIAVSIGRKATTLHKSVIALYALFGVKSRPALMALWLEGNESEAADSKRVVANKSQ